MIAGHVPIEYQVFYIVIPAISIIGNGFIVYVTMKANARLLRDHGRLDFCHAIAYRDGHLQHRSCGNRLDL
ncbi:hypothetical protein KIN20_001775 [Parelaphostrongylus tenuis]|uniref:Uncharacterized protein n=1 Tax=Parelaphostrongylus tenuis TaxID=148309 RepID=A0AAD5MMM3_PARTN|nr:hypothetical protein KIN20_001775 [Parelaphostrongylus tenuis]